MRRMHAPTVNNLNSALADAVEHYREHANIAALLKRIDELAAGTTADALIVAVEPFLDIPEVAGPVYEKVLDEQPENARALVILANCYWLAGRGPEVVEELASRAIAADPDQRGAWHMWSLSESDPRQRVARWQQVVARFPDDQLAEANLADNAASLAGAEHDTEALVLAIATYERLLERAELQEQKLAIEEALMTLRAWKL